MLSEVCGFSGGNMGRAADLQKTQVCATRCPLDAGHLWVAVRYAELNPVRAGLVGGWRIGPGPAPPLRAGGPSPRLGWKCRLGANPGARPAGSADLLFRSAAVSSRLPEQSEEPQT